jgi:hypothetical protein
MVLYTAPKNPNKIEILSVVARNGFGAPPQADISIAIGPDYEYVDISELGDPILWTENRTPDQFIKIERETQQCHDGTDCAKITISPGGGRAMVIWTPNCIIIRTSEDTAALRACPIDVYKRGNLKEATRITFWVRGETGKENIVFGIGGPDIPPIPGGCTGLVTLSKDWQPQHLDIANVNLNSVTGIFVIEVKDFNNPQGATIWVDTIQYEGIK